MVRGKEGSNKANYVFFVKGGRSGDEEVTSPGGALEIDETEKEGMCFHMDGDIYLFLVFIL